MTKNKINCNDIYGYLNVLGCTEVWNRLTAPEQQLGRQSICGCYNRLMESLEQDTFHGDSRVLYMQIQRREYLNATLNLPVGHPDLQAETEKTAKMLFEFVRGDLVSPAVKSQFLTELDKEIAKILEPKNATTTH